MLDPVGRRATETTVTGSTTSTVDLHYTGASDNPGWSRLTTAGTATTTRYIDSLSGDLSATLISDGTSTTADAALELAFANPHGDIVTTVPIPTSGPAAGIEAWASYDEYGNPSVSSNATPLEDTGIGYGWVGNKQRATQPHGLILMGARPYNPTTGQFTSRDPIHGGNTTTYTYPQDPINAYDLTGTQVYVPGGGLVGGYMPRLPSEIRGYSTRVTAEMVRNGYRGPGSSRYTTKTQRTTTAREPAKNGRRRPRSVGVKCTRTGTTGRAGRRRLGLMGRDGASMG